MRFEDLPGIPRAWFDFLKSELPAFVVPATIQDLASRAAMMQSRMVNPELLQWIADGAGNAAPLLESIGRLSRPDAVVVSARIYSSFLGGPIAQLLKCLTSIKLCELLRAHSINAVPVGWVDSNVPDNFPKWAITLADDTDAASWGISAGERVPDSIEELLSQIETFGRGAFDPDIFGAIKKSFAPGRPIASATASLYSTLLQQWGMILVDPADFRSAAAGPVSWDVAALLPVLAYVMDPFEICRFAGSSQTDRSSGKTAMAAWPQVSATIGDVRVRRTLDRYPLSLKQLYEGEAAVFGSIRSTFPRASLSKLSDLRQEVERRMGEVRTLASNDTGFPKLAASAQEKILFQLSKLQDQCETALNTKEQVAARRIHSACVLLAPNGHTQEMEMGAIQIPLRHSLCGLDMLYKRMDPMTFEHQLIWMD